MRRTFSQKKHKSMTRRGFTLIETLVAISIIMVGISATFSVVQFGLSSTIAVKDRITSAFLAQEALEAVRNMKDANLLAQNAAGGSITTPHWLAGIADASGNLCTLDGSGGCQYNFGNSASPFTSCSGNGCLLYVNTTTGLYSTSQATGAVASRFTRQINIQELATAYPNQKEAKVTVTITWPSHTFIVTEHITNWFAP